MLRSLQELVRYTVTASDGDVGSVMNFLFDDERWAVRYLVVRTGGFFDERRVLISPISFREVDWSSHTFRLALTRDRIKQSPGVDADLPVFRQHEREYYRYFAYPPYWGSPGVWGPGYSPALLGATRHEPPPEHDETGSKDAHLRSVKEVHGYHVQGSDGAVGFVDDFMVDDETWQIRYLVIDTSHWWWGHRILVAPSWASLVSWAQSKVVVNLSRDAIKSSPSWDPTSAIRLEYEERLHDYYGLRGYWGES